MLARRDILQSDTYLYPIFKCEAILALGYTIIVKKINDSNFYLLTRHCLKISAALHGTVS